jgi:hypothetical protein
MQQLALSELAPPPAASGGSLRILVSETDHSLTTVDWPKG